MRDEGIIDPSLYRELELSSPDIIREVQESRLREHIAYCREHSPYYRRLFEDLGVAGGEISLDRLSLLPFTDKKDIEDHNDELCAVDRHKIVDVVLSSGTTGRPTRIMYTEHDLQRLAYNERKSFEACGITSLDTALLTCTMDRCFIAGLAYFLGMRSLGAATIRNGLGSLESHAEIIGRLAPTVLVGVPTFLKKLGRFMLQNGMNPAGSAVSRLVCIGEPLRDASLEPLKLGRDLEEIWRAEAYSTYASSEIITSFCECSARRGGHLHPELAVVEIVDANGQPLPGGAVGEVVVTPLSMEGMPLIRFKTGDVSFLNNSPCECGRRSPRLGPILGRKQQMMKIRGTTLYPHSIFAALEEMDGVADYYVVATSEDRLSDNAEVYVSLHDDSCSEERIQEKLQARLRVKLTVKVADAGTLSQQVYNPKFRKPVRFIDRREVSC